MSHIDRNGRHLTMGNSSPPERSESIALGSARVSLAELMWIRGGGEHDGYWRSIDYKVFPHINLQHIPSRFHSPSERADRIMLNKSFSRGRDLRVLQYEECAYDELKRFIKARGIAGNSSSLQRCVKLLRQADLAPRPTPGIFFMSKLPPEMRQLVYTHYHSEFAHEALHTPSPPPPALVCREMREEFLPIFYKTSLFAIGLINTTTPQQRRLSALIGDPLGRKRHQMITKPETVAFFGTLRPDLLRNIRRLQIRIGHMDESKHNQPYLLINI